MSELLRMPTDEVTGLPHIIYPPDLSYVNASYPDVTYHHHFYNRRHPDLEGLKSLPGHLLDHPEDIPLPRIAGLAVRMSRGQRLPTELHRLVHNTFPLGPELPHTLEDKFVTTVMACSGVVSRWALDVTTNHDDAIKYVYMNDDVFRRMASPRLLCTERAYQDKAADQRRRVLGNFFLRYAIKQDLNIAKNKIDEFLFTTNDDRLRLIGHEILKEAMEVSIAPVVPIYRDLKLQGMVRPGRPDLRTSVWKYIHPDRREAAFRVLRKKLIAA